MKNNFVIRKAIHSDANNIHKVILAAFEEYQEYYTPEGFADTVMSEKSTLERMREMILYVAINQEGSIIGSIGWQKINEKEGHIRGMAVHPQWQGRNSPAKALLQIVENDAKSRGCTFLTLNTTEILKRAQKFYEKNGFKRTGKMGDFFGSTIYEYIKLLD
ncbi:MAG: GNAT family N-acetyltransferase [Promethearchaeota archaeon]|nr:MAG: GNAT family N-acetyltransferase [Candidatus Lokiarchaeota archaeon]